MLRCLLVILFVALLAWPVATLAQGGAQEQPVCEGAFTSARLLTLSCRPGFATASDQIQLRTSRDLDPARPWQNQLDYSASSWLFDVAADGTANLIIVFSQQGTTVEAQIYDDQDGDGQVSYRDQASVLVIEEGNSPPNDRRHRTERLVEC